MDGKSGTGTGKGCRGKLGSEREKAGTGNNNFSCNGKNREREKIIFPATGKIGNENGKNHLTVPVHA